jgi:hypothetical protein
MTGCRGSAAIRAPRPRQPRVHAVHTITVAFKKSKNAELNGVQQQLDKAHNGIRAIFGRGNARLKMAFKALRNISLDLWRIGEIVAAALVILHSEHGRTAPRDDRQ